MQRTQESLDKARITRAENKRKKEERAAKRLAKRAAAEAAAATESSQSSGYAGIIPAATQGPETSFAVQQTELKKENAAPAKTNKLLIDVNWASMPVLEAQQLYAQLRKHFEAAGATLNARLMAESQQEFYECFMAGRDKCCAKGTLHRSPARGTDYENGHKDPGSGLVTPVLICSENCWIRFQALLIQERMERNLVPRA